MHGLEVQRAAERRSLNILVEGRMRARPICVDLVDLSEGGCKVKGKRGFAREGETLTLKIEGFKAPLGTVVWVEDNLAGVAFDGQLHPAVLDHLIKKREAGSGGSTFVPSNQRAI